MLMLHQVLNCFIWCLKSYWFSGTKKACRDQFLFPCGHTLQDDIKQYRPLNNKLTHGSWRLARAWIRTCGTRSSTAATWTWRRMDSWSWREWWRLSPSHSRWLMTDKFFWPMQFPEIIIITVSSILSWSAAASGGHDNGGVWNCCAFSSGHPWWERHLRFIQVPKSIRSKNRNLEKSRI